ncbi:MAG: hypothetical protein H7Z38_21625 [Rubrivivax sp.]|nr:hypothetical protein [Pyrinomonadaceae bacterium]
MTTKKVTAKGGQKKRASSGNIVGARLEARARKIINDERRHDVDTRCKVEVALGSVEFWRTGFDKYARTEKEMEDKPRRIAEAVRELAALVERAEAGQSLADLSDLHPGSVEAARTVLRLIDGDGHDALRVPDFILDALMTTFYEVERRTGAKLRKAPEATEDDETWYSLETVAHLFERREGLTFRLEPERDLAGLISAVLSHRDTPAVVYNFLHDGINEALNQLTQDERVAFDNSQERIANVLTFVKKKEGDA